VLVKEAGNSRSDRFEPVCYPGSSKASVSALPVEPVSSWLVWLSAGLMLSLDTIVGSKETSPQGGV